MRTEGRKIGDRRQRGIAAVTALLVVALATMLAADLAWELHLDIRRSETQLLQAQATEFALGAEIMAIEALRRDFEDDQEQNEFCDYPGEGWDTEMTLPFEGGTVRGSLSDMQGRFNLNNLAPEGRKDEVIVNQFGNLLDVLDIPRELVPRVVDWIDPDQTEEFGGAEDNTYTSRLPPYRTANTWFTTTSELLAVDGFIDAEEPGPELYKALERYVSALPPGEKINVNSAEGPVLVSFAADSGAADAEALQANRPYCNLLTGSGDNAFMDDAQGIVDPEFTNKYLEVASNFFQLKVLVTLGTSQLTMYSLLHRDSNGVVTTSLRYFDTK
ncbi:MAG: type II secretion system minor pseudopilin GspK [Gammaproteobacteria bacterium]